MADRDRAAPVALTAPELFAELAREPYAYDFFQALRRLECAFRAQPRVGEAERPRDEPVRFAQAPTLMAAPSTLAAFEPETPLRAARLSQFFFGLLGPEGALPLHLTDYARQRLHHHRDATFARFLDLFHHRLLSLFYRAWASAEPAVQRDRPDTDRFVTYLGALCGIGMPSLRGRDALPDDVKLYYAGLLAAQSRNAAGLRAIIADHLQLPTRIEQFAGEWVTLGPEYRWHLGDRPRRGSGQLLGALGQSSVVGSRVWSRQHRFRVVLGPLSREQFRTLLPDGALLPRLTALVRSYVGDELSWDVKLVLEREAMRALSLGKTATLGQTSWLCATANSNAHWKDLVLDPLRLQPRAA